MPTTRKPKQVDATKTDAQPQIDKPIKAAVSLARLENFNAPGKQLVILDYIRYRNTGLLPVSFDQWVDICAALAAGGPSPSQLLSPYLYHFEVSELEQIDILTGYIDLLGESPNLDFNVYLAALFGQDLYAPEPETTVNATAAPEDDSGTQESGADDVDTDADDASADQKELSEPAPVVQAAPAAVLKHPGDRPGAKPGTRTPEGTRSRRTSVKPPEPEETPLYSRRVVYKTSEGRVIHGVCTEEDNEVATILDDCGDTWRAKRTLMKLDEGPIVWTITKAQKDMIDKMTRKGCGLWPDHDEDDVLFELVRRVSPDKLCVVTIHNAMPQPFVDAYVFDESAGEGEVNTPFEHAPPASIVSEYLFEVPDVGNIPARVLVGK